MAKPTPAPKPALLQEPLLLPSSGKKATFRKISGYDMIQAQRVCSNPDSRVEYGFALTAAKTFLDGRQAVLEDILALDEDDLALLSIHAVGGAAANFTGSTPKP